MEWIQVAACFILNMNHGGEFPWHKTYFVKWTLAVFGLITAVRLLPLKLVKTQWLMWLAILKLIAKHLKQNKLFFWDEGTGRFLLFFYHSIKNDNYYQVFFHKHFSGNNDTIFLHSLTIFTPFSILNISEEEKVVTNQWILRYVFYHSLS